jgi:Rrf2 family protein
MVLQHFHQQDLPDQVVQVKQLCEKYPIPFDTTSKIMQLLTKKSIFKSFQGAHGGHQLIKDLTQLSLLELCETIEQREFYVDCSKGPCYLLDECNIQGPFQKLNQHLTFLFSEISVLDFLHGNYQSGRMNVVEKQENEFQD